MSPCPTFIYPNFSFPCKSAQQLFFLSESLSHFLFPSLSHPNVVSKQPRKLYHNYTPDIDLSMFFGSCPATPHAPSSSSSLCFIQSPNSSFSKTKWGFKEWLRCHCHEGLGGIWGGEFRSTVWWCAYCHDNVVFFFFQFLSRSVVSCPFFTSVSIRELFKLISSVPRNRPITDALVCAATAQVFHSKV